VRFAEVHSAALFQKIRVSILLPNILQKILDKIGIQASFDAA